MSSIQKSTDYDTTASKNVSAEKDSAGEISPDRDAVPSKRDVDELEIEEPEIWELEDLEPDNESGDGKRGTNNKPTTGVKGTANGTSVKNKFYNTKIRYI